MIQIIQKPNKSLVIMAIGAIGGRLTTGSVHDVFTLVFVIAGAVWGLQEVFTGINWVRRLLGVVALVFVVKALISLVSA